MSHSAEYYRCLSTEGLLVLAREQGINPEMAVAMAERLEDEYLARDFSSHLKGGGFTFKQRSVRA